jgi:quinol-cytochrome oxidoreductase complex cytochrome b subunit
MANLGYQARAGVVEKQREEEEKEKTYPFFPDHLVIELIIAYILLAVLIILASLFPAGLEEKANPLVTPEHIKPEWYFVFLYQFLKLVPRTVGVFLPVMFGVLLLLLPFLDRSPTRSPRRRPVAMMLTSLVVAFVIIFTFWGLTT